MIIISFLGACILNTTELNALRNAAASSAMEGLPLDSHDLKTVKDIYSGKTTLAEYVEKLKKQYKEN